jgi:hypothetical protein
MKKIISDYIENFLSERRESNGQYEEVTQSDIYYLGQILAELISAKWERDPDGDLPIETMILDKTRFEMPPFEPIKRLWDAEEKDRDRILKTLAMNTSMALERLNMAINNFSSD